MKNKGAQRRAQLYILTPGISWRSCLIIPAGSHKKAKEYLLGLLNFTGKVPGQVGHPKKIFTESFWNICRIFHVQLIIAYKKIRKIEPYNYILRKGDELLMMDELSAILKISKPSIYKLIRDKKN